PEQTEAERDRLDSLPGPDERPIDEPVGVDVRMVMAVRLDRTVAWAVRCEDGARHVRSEDVPVHPPMGMTVHVLPVPMPRRGRAHTVTLPPHLRRGEGFTTLSTYRSLGPPAPSSTRWTNGRRGRPDTLACIHDLAPSAPR